MPASKQSDEIRLTWTEDRKRFRAYRGKSLIAHGESDSQGYQQVNPVVKLSQLDISRIGMMALNEAMGDRNTR